MPRGFLVKRVNDMPLLSTTRNDSFVILAANTGDDNVHSNDDVLPFSAKCALQYRRGDGVDSPNSSSPDILPPPLAEGAGYQQQVPYLLTDRHRGSACAKRMAVMAVEGARFEHTRNFYVDQTTVFKVTQWQRTMKMLAIQSRSHEILPSSRAISVLAGHFQQIYSSLLQNNLFTTYHQHCRALIDGANLRHATVRRFNFDKTSNEIRENERRTDSVKRTKYERRDTRKKRKLTISDQCTVSISKATNKTGSGNNSGDIGGRFNRVEATSEARAELAKIDNRLGDYVCRLCYLLFSDAFELARHRCIGIRTVEHRCPDCNKCFNCPANLASHRRWHKPTRKKELPSKAHQPQEKLLLLHSSLQTTPDDDEESYSNISADTSTANDGLLVTTNGFYRCLTCCKQFRRKSYLHKHAQGACPATHKPCCVFTTVEPTHGCSNKTCLTLSANLTVCQQHASPGRFISAAPANADASQYSAPNRNNGYNKKEEPDLSQPSEYVISNVDEYQRYFKKKFSALIGGVKSTPYLSTMSPSPS